MRADEIRSRFVDFFRDRGHRHLPSSPLVPEGDPTLLFVNAGMVPFKRAFQGEVEPPADRVVTFQKCLRVSGKHNDLEEVGRTARHHTFFEMLGNFSFGDYFKEEAIAYAWDFVVGELGLEPERLWATVHHTDRRARELWLELTELPPGRVLELGDRDNFWQMGETGPCGPCSELHYDLRPSDASDDLDADTFRRLGDEDRFMEIWNLVFMQFDRDESGEDRPLPAPSIDTGAGLERLAAILQGERTNYHIDLFRPLLEEVEDIVERPYPTDPERWEEGLPFRVLADHARAVAFLLADGVFPSNEGRGYVLRRILRRAGRYAWLLGRREPTLCRLVDVVVDTMGEAFPELAGRREHLVNTTRSEEERFLATIDEGMRRFEEIAPEGREGEISGRDAFKLYDTYGFPLDLTELMAEERGYRVDEEGFREALEVQRSRSRDDREAAGGARDDESEWKVARTVTESLVESTEASDAVEAETIRGLGNLSSESEQEFVGYDHLSVATEVLRAAARDGRRAFLLRENPFYAESGGQVSDRGTVRGDGWTVEVDRVVANERGQTVVAGPVREGEPPERPERVLAEVDERARRGAERNHTATHLLHAALREVLGEHVQQAGSLVAPDRLRFDFSHRGPLTAEERRRVEETVNRAVWENLEVVREHRDYREALDEGAMALFGEKYGDLVRVVSVPGVSMELCGGCHVRTTGQIGLFKVTSESGVAAGIRRIEAVTGPEAYGRVRENEERLARIAAGLGIPESEIESRLDALLEERDRLRDELARERRAEERDLAERLVAGAAELDGGRMLTAAGVTLPAGSDTAEFGDRLRDALGTGAAILHVVIGDGDEGKEAFLSVVTDDWIRRGVEAGELVRTASGATGSGGGGRAHFAQGGVGDPSLVEEALREARERVAGSLGGDA